MATKLQEQFLNDVKAQMYQFVYRNVEAPTNSLVRSLQEASGNGSLNWHNADNKEKLASIFTALATAVSDYTLQDGDFRGYLLLKLVTIVSTTYESELFSQYLTQGYNVTPESVEGSVSEAYSTQPILNTNFPSNANAANKFVPELPSTRLIPSSLYNQD